jgi:hypothetical protein
MPSSKTPTPTANAISAVAQKATSPRTNTCLLMGSFSSFSKLLLGAALARRDLRSLECVPSGAPECVLCTTVLRPNLPNASLRFRPSVKKKQHPFVFVFSEPNSKKRDFAQYLRRMPRARPAHERTLVVRPCSSLARSLVPSHHQRAHQP